MKSNKNRTIIKKPIQPDISMYMNPLKLLKQFICNFNEKNKNYERKSPATIDTMIKPYLIVSRCRCRCSSSKSHIKFQNHQSVCHFLIKISFYSGGRYTVFFYSHLICQLFSINCFASAWLHELTMKLHRVRKKISSVQWKAFWSHLSEVHCFFSPSAFCRRSDRKKHTHIVFSAIIQLERLWNTYPNDKKKSASSSVKKKFWHLFI